MTFEQALGRLDDIIALLSDNNTTLEQSLSLYAEGAALIERCGGELKEAKLQIERLSVKPEPESGKGE